MPDNPELLEGLVPAGLWGPPQLGSCLGLYLSPDAVSLAAGAVSGGKPGVTKIVTVPLAKAPAAEGEADKRRAFFTTDFLSNREALGQALRAGLTELGARSQDVVVALSHQLSITRYFLMNPVDQRFWKTAVPLEAKKYIPFPMDGLVHDFQVAPPVSEAKKSLMGVLLGVAPQMALGQVLQAARAAGLNPVAVEPSHCAVLRLWGAAGMGADGRAELRVHFDQERVFVILTRGGLPLLCREVDLPSDEYALSQKRLDLASALDFAERYLGIEEVAQVRVTGVGDMAQRTAMIARELALPVEKDAAGALPGSGSPDWGTQAAAGAALRALGPNPLTVDFTQTGRMRDEDKAVVLIGGVGLAVFLLFALGALVNEFQIVRAKQALARHTRKAADAGVTQGMTADDLKSKIERMKALVGTMQGMAELTPLASRLEALVDHIPDSVWLENVQYSDTLNIGEPSRRSLHLSGAALSGSRENDILTCNAFKETLLKEEKFAKGFEKLDISYTGGRGGGGAPLDAPGGAGGNKKTAFTLNAEAGKI